MRNRVPTQAATRFKKDYEIPFSFSPLPPPPRVIRDNLATNRKKKEKNSDPRPSIDPREREIRRRASAKRGLGDDEEAEIATDPLGERPLYEGDGNAQRLRCTRER